MSSRITSAICRTNETIPKHPALKVLVFVGYIAGAIVALPFIGGMGILVIQLITGDRNPEPLGLGIAVAMVMIPLACIGLVALLVAFGLSFRKKKEPLGSKLKRGIEEV